MTLQSDWLKYLEDPVSIEPDHFGPLITDTEDPVDLKVAFSDLPNGAELISRIEMLRSETLFTGMYHIADPARRLSKSDMRVLAERYADSAAKLLYNIGDTEIARQCEFNPIEYVYKWQWKRSDPSDPLNLSDAFDFIGDEFLKEEYDVVPYVLGLKSAVLSMTMIPEVTRYVLQAMFPFQVDDEAAYKLWIGGARVDFGVEKTYIILPDDYDDTTMS